MPDTDTKISFEELETVATQQATATTAETVTVTPPAAGSTTVAEETKPQFTEADVEAYRTLTEMGITPQNAAQFKAAKEGLDNLPKLMKSPAGLRALMDEVQKADPEAYKVMTDVISDRWFEDLPASQKTSGNGSVSRTAESAPDQRLDSLITEVKSLREERQQERTEKENARINAGWNKAFDELESKLPEGTTERDRDYIRLKAEKLLWSDTSAQGRVNKGVYIDVPKYYAEATKRVTAETKAAANGEHARREGVQTRAAREIVPAAENVNGARDSESKDIWDDKQMGREASALFAGKK